MNSVTWQSKTIGVNHKQNLILIVCIALVSCILPFQQNALISCYVFQKLDVSQVFHRTENNACNVNHRALLYV